MHLNAGKQDSPNLRKVISFISCLIVLSSSQIFSQIYINGFIKFEEYPSFEQSQKITSLLFDYDGRNDLIVLTGAKSLALYLSSKDYDPLEIKLPFNISYLKKIKSEKNSIVCLFTSRGEKTAGLLQLYSSGGYRILNRLKFDSYPTEFSLYKRGAKTFALLYGENFNGLELLIIEENKINSLKLVDKRILNKAEFIDIDYDGLIDICYQDIISNEIRFLMNDRRGGFEHQRTLEFNKPLISFNIIDFNFDGFFDLIYNFGNTIEVSFGDSVSTLQKRELLIKDEDESIEKALTADFNHDGYYDIAVIAGPADRGNEAQLNKTVKIYFSSKGYDFSRALDYYSGNEVKDIETAGYNPAELAVLAGNGVKVISQRIDARKMKAGLNPTRIFKFKDGEGFFVYDSTGGTVLFLTDNSTKLYSISLSHYFDKLKYYEDGKNIYLYFFEKNKRWIEIAVLNLNNGSNKKSLIYSHIPVSDIVISPGSVDTIPKIFVLSHNKNKLDFIEIYYKDIRYISSEPSTFSNKIYDFDVSGNKMFFLENYRDGELGLKSYNFENSLTENYKIEELLRISNDIFIHSFPNKRNEDIIIIEERNKLYILYNNKINRIAVTQKAEDPGLTFGINKFAVSYLYFKGSNGMLYKVGPLENINNSLEMDELNIITGKNFFINYSRNNKELVYNLDKVNGHIELIWEE